MSFWPERKRIDPRVFAGPPREERFINNPRDFPGMDRGPERDYYEEEEHPYDPLGITDYIRRSQESILPRPRRPHKKIEITHTYTYKYEED
jgi:hypothetical protein